MNTTDTNAQAEATAPPETEPTPKKTAARPEAAARKKGGRKKKAAARPDDAAGKDATPKPQPDTAPPPAPGGSWGETVVSITEPLTMHIAGTPEETYLRAERIAIVNSWNAWAQELADVSSWMRPRTAAIVSVIAPAISRIAFPAARKLLDKLRERIEAEKAARKVKVP